MKLDAILTLKISKSLKEAAKKKDESECLLLSDIVRILLADYVRNQGLQE